MPPGLPVSLSRSGGGGRILARANEVFHVAGGRIRAAERVPTPPCMIAAEEAQSPRRTSIAGARRRPLLLLAATGDGGNVVHGEGRGGCCDLSNCRDVGRGALKHDLVRSRGHGSEG